MPDNYLTHPNPAFTDERGSITNILSGFNIRHAALITCNAGAVRGNHYHPDAGGTQYVYVLEGELLVALQRLTGPFHDSWIVEAAMAVALPEMFSAYPGDLIRLDPYTAHAFRAITDAVFLALDEYPATPDVYEQVTRPYQLVKP